MSALVIRNKFLFTIGFLVLISGIVYSTAKKHNDIIMFNLFIWGVLIMWLGYKKTNGQVVNNSFSNAPIAKISTEVNTQPVIKFDKIQEIINHVNHFNGYLLIKTLKPINDISTFSDVELIANVILSKYHIWEGEKHPDGVVWNGTVNGDKCATMVKSYGFFDNTKIKPEHYKQLTYDDFLNQLTAVIEEEIENDEMFVQRVKNVIDFSLSRSATYYYLDLDEKKNADLVSKWNVYDFFYAYISVDRANDLITLIEFGLD